MTRDFYFGAFTYFILNQINMDLMGKEIYLQKVEDYWSNTTVYQWGFVWLVVFIFWAYLGFRDIKNDNR
jgi:hypothetical protein